MNKSTLIVDTWSNYLEVSIVNNGNVNTKSELTGMSGMKILYSLTLVHLIINTC